MRKFIKEIKRDFKPAYEQLIKNMKRRAAGKKPWAAPFDGYRKYPGRNTHLKLLNLIMGTMAAIGIITGLLLAVPLIAVTVYLFGSFNYLYFLLLPLLALCPVIIHQMNNYLLGYMGERVVAEALEKCFRKPTWRLFHSLQISEYTDGDIDHVVVCPKGIFCVEAKASRWGGWKEIDIQDGEIRLGGKNIFKNTIKQATNNAIDLQKFLNKQCSFEVPFVFPIILFADDNNSSYVFSGNLIVGKSKGITGIFNEFIDKHDVFNKEQIEKIGTILEEKNRVKIEE